MAGLRELIRDSQREYEADTQIAADSALRGDAPIFVPYDTATTQQVYVDHTSNPYAYPQGYVDPAATTEMRTFPYDREDVQWPDYLRTFEAEGHLEDIGLWTDPAMHPPLQYGGEAQLDPAAFAGDLGTFTQTQQALDDEWFLDPLLRSTHPQAIDTTALIAAEENQKRDQAGDAVSVPQTQFPSQTVPFTQSFQSRYEPLLDPPARATTNPTIATTAPKSLRGIENGMQADNDNSVTKQPVQPQSVLLGQGPQTGVQTGVQTGMQSNTHSGNGSSTHAGLIINTRTSFTKEQEIEVAKEKMALRPTNGIPTDAYSINLLIGRPPAILRKESCLKQQNSNWFSEFTVDELLHNMHPDDLCGTLIIEVAKQYSGPEIAVHANHLYELLGKKAKTENNYTKRIVNAVMHLCKNDKTDHASIIDAMQQDRTTFRVHDQPGTKTEEKIQQILAAQAELAAQRARIAKAATEAAQFAREAKAARERARPAPMLPIPTYPSVPPNALTATTNPLASGDSRKTTIMKPSAPALAPAPPKRKRATADQDDDQVPPKKQVKRTDAGDEVFK